MKKFAVLLLAGLAFVSVARAQYYTVTKETSLSSSAEVITIQLPTTGNLRVRGDFVSVESTADCEIQLEHSGTAATTTALAITSTSPSTVAAAFEAFHTSNVGAGTVFGVFTVKGGGPAHVFELTHTVLSGAFSASNLANFSVRTATCTADVKVIIGVDQD